ncbi:MAG: hypothetical protein ACTSUE_15985 [Promethearchaeota archaeon]
MVRLDLWYTCVVVAVVVCMVWGICDVAATSETLSDCKRRLTPKEFVDAMRSAVVDKEAGKALEVSNKLHCVDWTPEYEAQRQILVNLKRVLDAKTLTEEDLR